MVEKDRAGTTGLRRFFQTEITKLKEANLKIKNQIPEKSEITESQQGEYYRNWLVSAVHIALTIPELRTPIELSKRLGVSVKLIQDALIVLETLGMAIEKNGLYTPAFSKIHLGDDSPWIRSHHQNWRQRTIQQLDKNPGNVHNSLHYSSVISLSEKSVPRVRQIMVDAIKKIREEVKDSEEERLYAYNLDYFQLDHSSQEV